MAAQRAPNSAHAWHACTHWHRTTCLTHLYNTRIWAYTYLDTQVCGSRGHGADAPLECLRRLPKPGCRTPRLACYGYILACPSRVSSTCCHSSALTFPAKDDTSVEGACKSDRGVWCRQGCRTASRGKRPSARHLRPPTTGTSRASPPRPSVRRAILLSPASSLLLAWCMPDSTRCASYGLRVKMRHLCHRARP